MKTRTKPTEWKLQPMSNEQLLRIAINKLRSRTIQEGEKMDEIWEAGRKDERQRSKFYAMWYAFEALRIYLQRKNITVAEPFLEPIPEPSVEEKIEEIFDDFGHELINNTKVTRREMNSRYRKRLVEMLRSKK